MNHHLSKAIFIYFYFYFLSFIFRCVGRKHQIRKDEPESDAQDIK